jgi:hypothetical protein
MLDTITGEETEPEYPTRRNTSKGWGSRGTGTRTSTPARAEFKAPASKKKPAEVSDRVWELSEQWMEMATAALGQHPRVNQAEFAKRLDAKIAEDKSLGRWLRFRPEWWQEHFPGKWESGVEFLNDVLARMLEMFFGSLTDEQVSKPGSLQFAFLTDEWDEWCYHATTSVQVAWHKEHGDWEAPTLPKAVFDPATIHAPKDEDPCTDPMFEGMTWGEVRAQADEDREFFVPSTEEDDEALKEQLASARGTFARLKSVMLSNRESTTTTTKETTR